MGPEKTQSQSGPAPLEGNPAGFSTTVTDTTLSEALITLRKRRWVLILRPAWTGLWRLQGGDTTYAL